MIFLSPLLGALISTIIMVLYVTLYNSITDFFSIIESVPLVFTIFSVISYVLSFPIGYFLIKRKNFLFWSDGYFMFIAFVFGTILGIVFSGINFYIEDNISKAIIIFLCFSLGSLFNASFYISLVREINKNEKK